MFVAFPEDLALAVALYEWLIQINTFEPVCLAIAFSITYSAVMPSLQLLVVPFPLLLSHHNQRRIDKSAQNAGVRPLGAKVLGNTSESLLPSYLGRGQRLGLEELGLSGSAWRRREVVGEIGISVGVLRESLMAD